MKTQFDLEAFVARLEAARTMVNDEGVSWKMPWTEVSYHAGVSPSAFTRMTRYGLKPDANNLVKLLVWLGDSDLKPFIKQVGDVNGISAR